MQFGLFMMPLHPPHRAFADGYDRDVDQIVLADQLGFREAWVGEHLTERWENAPAPDLLIAKALALTKTVKLGTGVTLLALHNPVYLAHRLAMLDHMARGRFQWGIGGGGIPTDLVAARPGPHEPRARCGRGRPRCWTSCSSCGRPTARFRYHGQFFDIETPAFDPVKARGYYMKPYQRPHPPIAVAASTPNSSSMRMAGERGWIPMSSSLLSRPYLKDHWRLVEDGAAKGGRQAKRSQWRIARDVLVGADARAGPRAGADGDGPQLRRSPAPEPRRHDPDDLDEARADHARRRRDRRLPDGQRVDRGRSRRSAPRRSTSSTRRAGASARCWPSPPTPTTRAGTTRACASSWSRSRPASATWAERSARSRPKRR